MENNWERNQAHERSQQVEIKFMWKDRGSNVGNCPAQY